MTRSSLAPSKGPAHAPPTQRRSCRNAYNSRLRTTSPSTSYLPSSPAHWVALLAHLSLLRDDRIEFLTTTLGMLQPQACTDPGGVHHKASSVQQQRDQARAAQPPAPAPSKRELKTLRSRQRKVQGRLALDLSQAPASQELQEIEGAWQAEEEHAREQQRVKEHTAGLKKQCEEQLGCKGTSGAVKQWLKGQGEKVGPSVKGDALFERALAVHRQQQAQQQAQKRGRGPSTAGGGQQGKRGKRK